MSTLFAIIIMKINTTPPDEHIFTQRLATIDKPPKRLCFMGKLPENNAPTVSIVGTRKPSAYGKEVTQKLAAELARRGFVVVSGLALGVDSIAQRAALEAGGTVVAVVANELPEVSPRSNQKLAEDIISSGGAVMSEWKKGDNITIGKWSFLERNRLVSGLADAVIITEAAERSGTLNTAAHALNQGRELFVVPGNITSPLSAGCNKLLKQGANPITSAQDIIDIIAPNLNVEHQETQVIKGSSPAENKIIHLIQSGIRDGETLQQKSGLEPADFAMSLTMLEINGIIKPLGANQWTIAA